MKKQLTHLVCGLAFTCALMGTLSSCDPKLDYDDIDPSAKVEMGLAIPVGEMNAKIGDFLGDTTFKFINVLSSNVYQYTDTFFIKREYHSINLSKYFTNVTDTLHVSSATALPVIPAGQEVKLTFPLGVKLSNVNADTDNERLDEMYISIASFTSAFGCENFGLQFSDIKKLELILPEENFSRAAGTTLDIPVVGNDFGSNIPINVDNFVISLLKDKTQEPGKNNVSDSVTFFLRFTVQPSTDLAIDDDSKINYNFAINLMEYTKLLGYFSESNEMHENDTIVIADEWSAWTSIKNLRLPLAEPELQLDITHSIAAPLKGHIYDFEVIEDATGKTMRATFNNGKDQAFDKIFQNMLTVNDPDDAVCTNSLIFNKDNGDLDKLFSIRPDRVFYKYDMTPYNNPSIKQYRITNNTKVDIAAILRVPFRVNEGTDLSYADTTTLNIPDISINQFMAEVDEVDSIKINDVKLVLTAESEIPFDITGKVVFLDENGNDVGVHLNDGNTITIAGPTNYKGVNSPSEPGKSVLVANINQDDLDRINSAKKIYYDLHLTDVADNSKVIYPVELNTNTSLKIKIAVAADVEGYLRLAFGDNK